MSQNPLGVAIVGCGNIAESYARHLVLYPEVQLVGVTDLEPQRAAVLATKYSCRAYPDLTTLLADPAVALVVNLTIHQAHTAVVSQCLEAGKHVHSEKPLALTYEEARGLVELARQNGARLGCSPFTFMGEAQQTAWKMVNAGRLGQVRVAYAEVNWGRIETWHPNPAPFYEVGPLFDVGVYPLTILTAMFGPARTVAAYGKTLYPDRVTQAGTPFRVKAPDFMMAAVELESGLLARLTANFYVGRHSFQKGIELHGDKGSLYLSSWHDFNAEVAFAEFNQAYQPVPPVKAPYEGVEWGRAVLDLAQAIQQDRPHRASGEQAAHVVEILCAVAESAKTGRPVPVASSFTPPALMEWAA